MTSKIFQLNDDDAFRLTWTVGDEKRKQAEQGGKRRTSDWEANRDKDKIIQIRFAPPWSPVIVSDSRREAFGLLEQRPKLDSRVYWYLWRLLCIHLQKLIHKLFHHLHIPFVSSHQATAIYSFLLFKITKPWANNPTYVKHWRTRLNSASASDSSVV